MADEIRPSTPTDKPSVASSAAWTTITTVGAAFFALFNAMLMFRVLEPAGRGEVAWLTVLANLTMAASMFGVEVAHGNILGQEPHRRRNVTTNSIVLAALLGGAAIAIVTSLFGLFPSIKRPTTWSLALLALAAVPMMVLQLYFRWLAITEYRFKLANATMIMIPASNVAINGVLAATGEMTVTTALLAWIAAQTAAFLVLSWWVTREIGFGRPDVPLMKRALSFGAKNHLTSTMQLANFRLDQLFVGALANNTVLGFYATAVAFAETLFYLPQAVAQVLRPDLIRAKAREAAELAARGLRVTLILTGAICAVLMIGAPYFLELTFGAKSLPATDMLRVLAPGAIGIAMTKLCATALSSQNHPLAGAIAIGISLAVTIVLDIVLIPAHGGVGAAIASTSAYLLAGVLIAIVFGRVFRVPPTSLVPRPADLKLLVQELRARRGAVAKTAQTGP